MNKLNTQKSKKFVKQNEVEETTSKDDTLNHIIEFDVKNLERIFKENNQRVSTLKEKNKAASEKSGEVLRSRQEEKEIRGQIKNLEAKKAQLLARNKKILESKSFKELGYKNKTEPFQKLGIESKDYVVIPIPKMVTRLTDVFEEEKRLKIDIDGNSHYAVYTNDVASGRINTCEDVESYDSVLLVPITSLNKAKQLSFFQS